MGAHLSSSQSKTGCSSDSSDADKALFTVFFKFVCICLHLGVRLAEWLTTLADINLKQFQREASSYRTTPNDRERSPYSLSIIATIRLLTRIAPRHRPRIAGQCSVTEHRRISGELRLETFKAIRLFTRAHCQLSPSLSSDRQRTSRGAVAICDH